MQRATFAAGCYWGTERYFTKQFGNKLHHTAVGFMGGNVPHANYQQVCGGDTGHAEVFSFEYNPTEVSYVSLVDFFFRMHNPTAINRQGNDTGTQYRSAIFYHDEEQRAIAEEFVSTVNDGKASTATGLSLSKLEKAFGSGVKVATVIEPAACFYSAHEEHQSYLAKNLGGYCNHRMYIPLEEK